MVIRHWHIWVQTLVRQGEDRGSLSFALDRGADEYPDEWTTSALSLFLARCKKERTGAPACGQKRNRHAGEAPCVLTTLALQRREGCVESPVRRGMRHRGVRTGRGEHTVIIRGRPLARQGLSPRIFGKTTKIYALSADRDKTAANRPDSAVGTVSSVEQEEEQDDQRSVLSEGNSSRERNLR